MLFIETLFQNFASKYQSLYNRTIKECMNFQIETDTTFVDNE